MPEFKDIEDPLTSAINERMPGSLKGGEFVITYKLLSLGSSLGDVLQKIIERANAISASVEIDVEIATPNQFSGVNHMTVYNDITVTWSK